MTWLQARYFNFISHNKYTNNIGEIVMTPSPGDQKSNLYIYAWLGYQPCSHNRGDLIILLGLNRKYSRFTTRVNLGKVYNSEEG